MRSGATIVSIIIGIVSESVRKPWAMVEPNGVWDGRFGVDVDELVVHRGVGERIDTLLVDLEPIGDPGLLTNPSHQLLGRNDLHDDSSRSISEE